MQQNGGKTATILVVDDNPTNLGVLFDYLDDHDFSVLVADDGEAALAQAEYAQPDIILLDVMMPGIDGYETCRRLCANSATAEIPIVFMTALTDAEDKVKCFRAGGVDYVPKPFHNEEVLARILNHLRTRWLERDLRARNEELEAEIASRRRAENALQSHISELRVSNGELDAFARSVAHDLRDPLSAVVGFAQLVLEDPALSADSREAVEHILRTGYKMSNIIRELLLLAQVRDADVVREPVDMTDLVDSSCQRLSRQIRETQPEIAFPERWPRCIGYAPWIEEVWVNYLSNAIKYGGQPPRIEFGATPLADDRIKFWIRDNGLGVSSADRERLFTDFSRLSRNRAEGYGLGLSIVRRIIEKIGGEVGVDDAPGGGSEFYFVLPAADA